MYDYFHQVIHALRVRLPDGGEEGAHHHHQLQAGGGGVDGPGVQGVLLHEGADGPLHRAGGHQGAAGAEGAAAVQVLRLVHDPHCL